MGGLKLGIMKKLILVVHNVRSALNVGALLRTADAVAVDMVYLAGYTPFPKMAGDSRLPHQQDKIDREIHKTALGAEKSVSWEYSLDIAGLIGSLQQAGVRVAALEQTPAAVPLRELSQVGDMALIVGNEVDGLDDAVLALADQHLMIPMLGAKESHNVASAAAIALYHLRFIA